MDSGSLNPGSPTNEACSVTQRMIVLHDSGDVTLLIGEGEQQQAVLVSKMVLCLASPVWKAMFSGNWSESDAKEIPLPEDDVDTMVLVLRIAHLQFKDLPGKDGLSFDALYNLAIVCDKYDLVKLVRPFLDLYQWAKQHNRSPVEFESPFSPHWLFVAWTFGYTDSFDAHAKHLAYTIAIGEDGSIQDGNGRPVLGEYLPPGILESILKIREDTLSTMLKDCYDVLDRLSSVSSQICLVTDDNGKRIDEDKCRSVIFGSFVRQLFTLGLYPTQKTGADMHISVSQLEDKFLAMHIEVHESYDLAKVAQFVRNRNYNYYGESYWTREENIKSLRNTGLRSHDVCGEAFSGTKIAAAVSLMPSPTLDSHRKYMEVQAKK